MSLDYTDPKLDHYLLHSNVVYKNANTAAFLSSGNLVTPINAITINASGNITGSNVNIVGTLNVGGQINTAGTITAQTVKITGIAGVGTLDAAIVSSKGLITGGSIKTVGAVTAEGNIQGANILTTGVVSASANITGKNFKALGNIVSVGNIDTVGNITAPVGTVSSNAVTALAVLQLPIYKTESDRDQAVSDPKIGMMAVVSDNCQIYINGAWTNLALG
jgi:hypothetical protein